MTNRSIPIGPASGAARRASASSGPSKPLGPAQQAPLTPEYQKIFEASLADQKAGGQGGDPTYTCIPPACRAR